MGNRATVVFTDGKGTYSPAVYLHWNGGAESIYGFLEELDRRKVGADQDYECARFVQLVGEFFDSEEQSGHSLGITNSPKSDKSSDLDRIQTDHGDNGLYLVNRTGSTLAMRRFTEQPTGLQQYDYTFKEWTTEQVEQEHQDALKSDYIPSFREFYAELRESKKKAETTQAVAA